MPTQTPLRFQFISTSVEETQSLGIKIGRHIHTATLITLSGDLGSGKTAFVQGLAKGLDVPEDYYITSPTYTLLNEYPGRFPLYHFDFYRLENAADIYSTGFYEKLDNRSIIAVEWADRLSEDLHVDHIRMEFIIRDDDSRILNITAIGHEPIHLIKKIGKE
ncbi:MAG: tRNA (adenosine(37)-N6)-threonylcarbamoyltransferase complex ATPase subunit type 1 TsaE [Deltaproteobacteria bacterium]|nr:tRNA (adenosine(37)-N6)-threonylcarbamoyltransferase complex ATPase subunit type 1 TsaE [Deltaproteobacteria bacterium]